jgi:hypothetical protein
VSRPQVIDDQEHERIHERVAAVDVAKDTGMVCTRTPVPCQNSHAASDLVSSLLIRLLAGTR